MNANYQNLVVDSKTAAEMIKNGMTVAFGGQVGCGCPKALPKSLVEMHHDDNFKINVLTTSNNQWLDDLFADANIVKFRAPMTDSRSLSNMINANEVIYCEQQMHKMPRLVKSGVFGNVDYYIIEAVSIEDDGTVYFANGIGIAQTFIDSADGIIIELNRALPPFLCDIQDCISVDTKDFVPLKQGNERIGKKGIKVPSEKIKAIILTDELDNSPILGDEVPNVHKSIANNLVDFLKCEKKHQGWEHLPPLQTGFGNLANSIIRELGRSGFENISFFAGHIQPANIDLLIQGSAIWATGSSFQITKANVSYLNDNSELLKKKLVLRNSEIINNSGVTSQVSPITITGCIECDFYGNVNSSHISGNRVLNGLGGAPNFMSNSGLAIIVLPSTGKDGNISTIVPMVSHQDISEHDVDVIITENGVADLRGKSDRERAQLIIDNCAADEYKEQLKTVFQNASLAGGHHPVDLANAFEWHIKLKKEKTMKGV